MTARADTGSFRAPLHEDIDPPPVSPPSRAGQTWEETLDKRWAAFREFARATDARFATTDAALAKLKSDVGRAPDVTKKGDEGEGLYGLAVLTRADVAGIREDVHELAEAIEAREKARREEDEARARAAKETREPWSRVAWIIVTVALSTVVSGGLIAAGAALAKHIH